MSEVILSVSGLTLMRCTLPAAALSSVALANTFTPASTTRSTRGGLKTEVLYFSRNLPLASVVPLTELPLASVRVTVTRPSGAPSPALPAAPPSPLESPRHPTSQYRRDLAPWPDPTAQRAPTSQTVHQSPRHKPRAQPPTRAPKPVAPDAAHLEPSLPHAPKQQPSTFHPSFS